MNRKGIGSSRKAGPLESRMAELVHAQGGFPIALVKDAGERRMLGTKIAAVATSESGDLAEVVHRATDGRGADVALNGIGASVMTGLLASMAPGGRIAVYAAGFGGREFLLDLASFYAKRLELIGVTTAKLDAVRAAAILNTLRPMFEDGSLDPPRIAESYPLSDFAKAYARTAAGAGKIVLHMA